MPIVNGRYEARISTTYATPEEGLDAIVKRVQKARRLRINGIPMEVLRRLMPYLKNKDVKIILPLGEEPTDDVKALGSVGVTKARIYVDYMGSEANSGSITFPDRFFSIVWRDDRVLSVSAMEMARCAKCMMDAFEGAWHYSAKSRCGGGT